MEPLTFVLFKWKPFSGYRSKFDGETVNVMARMIKRHYRGPLRIVCLTDDAGGINEPGVELFELWNDFATVPNPSGKKNPSCYRRLRLFAKEPGAFLGPRFVCIDLDAVILDDITDLFNPGAPFKIWRSGKWNPYNGSLFMLEAGARPQVWKDFDPIRSPRAAVAGGCRGSDQGWIAHRLGPDESTWGTDDGVYSLNIDLRERGLRIPPKGAKLVICHGSYDPWKPEFKRDFPEIERFYR